MSVESHTGYKTEHATLITEAKQQLNMFSCSLLKKPAMFVLKRSIVNVTFSLNLPITVL